jgi:SAM-dependent methyltransferase
MQRVERGTALEAWTGGAAYEPYVGRWSRRVAPEVVTWMGVPGGCRWLDAGCGTGALCAAVLAQAAPQTVVGIDAAEEYVRYAQEQLADPHLHFSLGDLHALPFAAATFDAAVTGLVLNFVKDAPRVVRELRRVVRPGGRVGAYVWDYAEGMAFMRAFWDAASALDPRAAELDQGQRFPLCRPQPLADLFTAAGLEQVSVRAVEIPTHFRDFDDFWQPFLGGQGSAPGYVKTLTEKMRGALQARLRADLPTAADGSISLQARAWAVQGTVAASAE